MTIAIRAAAIAALLLLPCASKAGAQAAPISFDALPRKGGSQTAAVPESNGTKPRKALANRDSVARGQPSAKPSPAPVRAARVDTLYLSWVDTVRIHRVDTVMIAVESGPSIKPAPTPAAIAAPAFTAAGLTQVMLAGGDAMRTTYRLRRVELKVTADLGNKAQAVMMVDAAKALALNTSGAQLSVTQSTRMLQDAFITMPVGRVTVEAGQQRLPLGYEGAMSASGLETVERALMESDKARYASFGDVRDAGVAVRQTWGAVDYRIGVFNGSGETMNDVDRQVAKAVVGQLAFHPAFAKGLRLGVSGATSGSAAGDNPTRNRIGADVRFLRGPASIQMEAMTGQDGATKRLGGYALTTYALRCRVKLVARVDAWDPDRANDGSAASIAERDYLGGFTWLPAGTRLKLQLNVVHKTYSAGAVPSATLVLSQLQASW